MKSTVKDYNNINPLFPTEKGEQKPQERLLSNSSTEPSETAERSLNEDIGKMRGKLQGLVDGDRPLKVMLSYRSCSGQVDYPINKQFLDGRHVNSKMRSKVVRWMNSLCDQLELVSGASFMAVAILDHYISLHDEEVKTLQLTAAACVWIGSKLTDTRLFSPEVFVYSCSGIFTEEELFNKETQVLQMVGFRTVHVNPSRVLRRIATLIELPAEQLAYAMAIVRTGLENLTIQNTPLLDMLAVALTYVEQSRPLGVTELQKQLTQLAAPS